MIRLCPNCNTERPLSEFFCEGSLPDGATCNWDLSAVPIRASGSKAEPSPSTAPSMPARVCPNGHPVDDGDLICMECGASLESDSGEHLAEAVAAIDDTGPVTGFTATEIGDWILQSRLHSSSIVREQFQVAHRESGRDAVLEIYSEGSEPDRSVYDAISGMPHDHLPEIFETGRWQERAYEVRELVTYGTLGELDIAPSDVAAVRTIALEIGRALASFSQAGLRHRDIRPDNILIRTREPLDLVVTGFGSARLSDFDLDVVAPLETTRYMAPEAIAGGVAAASDWWSLGMILLEITTGGACFDGINSQAFLINVLTNGTDIPSDLEPEVRRLLLGLLARDHRTRWQWEQVRTWADGQDAPLPPEATLPSPSGDSDLHASITLGGRSYAKSSAYALAAAEPTNWDEARNQAVRGITAAWAEDAKLASDVQAAIRRLAHTEGLSDDLRLSLTLKILHPAMPLVVKGNIVTPGWLLDHPDEGTQLVFGAATEFLSRLGAEEWLQRLRQRGEAVRNRSRLFEIALNEDELRIHLLSTSKARLSALWSERRRILPDTDHPGLNSLIERRQTTEEDLILLLGAEVDQFRSRDEIVEEAAEAAAKAGVTTFDSMEAAELLGYSRRDLHRIIEDRIAGFARCDIARVDEWADRFRLDHRIPLDRALALLAVPPETWKEPPKQSYVSTLLDYFSKKISGSILRGPLTRMTIGKTTPRFDLMELDTARRPARALLDHILARTDRAESLDPSAFGASETLERRLRALHQHALLYKRDTGIDGLYMGFPFLVYRDDRTKPKIAPILLWPTRLVPEVGNRGHATVAFDRDRDEVRLNPAFEGLIGIEASRRWQDAAKDLLGRATLTASDVMDGFAGLGEVRGRSLTRLPNRDADVEIGQPQIVCAATLFHLAYMGQAIVEDLRQLRSRPLDGSGLETALKVTGAEPNRPDLERVPEADRYFTVASDPSQEAAVLEARQPPGLLIEGPPGTGKSQTIVNMVADAIGRKKSILVICQKQAALEVVKKRLEAEGLEERIFMITDMNRDREPVLRAIRNQLEANRGGYGGQSWRRERQLAALRIESLEADLDRHHTSIHDEDEATGLSYRTIVGELLAIERDSAPLDVPALRRQLGSLRLEEIAALEDACGPNARVWLPSQFEGNPLRVVNVFQPDPAIIDAFTADLEAFRNSENDRLTVLKRTEGALPMEEPEPYRRWYADHDDDFRSLGADERMELARWLPLCRRDAGGAETRAIGIAERLGALRDQIDGLPGSSPEPTYSAVTTAMADSALVAWVELATAVTTPPSLLGRLNPLRWSRARKMHRFLDEAGLDPLGVETFLLAGKWEQNLRPLRGALSTALNGIGEAELVSPAMPAPELAAIAGHRAAALWNAQSLADTAAKHPAAGELEAAIKAATLSEYDALRTSAEHAYERYEAKQFSKAALANVEQWFEPKWIGERANAVDRDGSNGYEIGKILEAMSVLEPYQKFRLRLSTIPLAALDIFQQLRQRAADLSALPAYELENEVRRIIRREALLAWKTRLETENSTLLYEPIEIQNKVRALAEADKSMRRANRALLTKGVDFTRVASEREWEPITRLRGQRAQRLREFLEKGADLGLMELRPVWLMNPDVASRVLPLRKGLFDIVIYDEASQMPVEYALPSLYRGQVVVVSGDEKQMPPTAFFSSKVENDEADAFDAEDLDEDATEAERETYNETWNRREIKDCPDLLQLAKAVLPTTTLQIHYRSEYRELIGFSNASFYANRLNVPVRHPDDEVGRARPIEVVRVDGTYQNQTNEAEASKIVAILGEIWNGGGKTPTVGVVTFNRKQADLIEEMLEEEAEKDSWFGNMLAKERDRIEGGEDVGFFVKNVENVQGDERDYIIFSSTFGRNQQGSFRRNFGVLGQKGGERRLNVAVTRARTKVIMVTSIPIGEVSDMLSSRRRPSIARDYLQGYLEYARAMSDGEFESGRGLLNRLLTERSGATHIDEDPLDGFAASVGEFLGELGLKANQVNDETAFGLDFAIEDPRTGLYGLGIECDAPRHHILDSARAREVWRPSVLRRSIPHVHRVSCFGWYHSRHEEERRLKAAVEAALYKEAAE